MKKSPTTFLIAISMLLAVSGSQAQSVQEGVNDLYAERYKGAKATFEKLIAANPNNIDATYWLGQALIASGDVPAARNVYSKALMTSANAPLLIVGIGQVELIENKPSEASQRFEAAITMTRGKKGDDPVILNAIGRAIVNTYTDKEKKGDINYALEKLEAASLRDPNNAEIFLNLGNAYRKAKPGEGGGKAFENYRKANAANPNFAPPYHRLAKLFETQKNRELFEQYLNDAITKDPRFAPAYYDLYYYRLGKLDFPAAQDMAAKYIANSDPDPQADHFKAQTYWAEKKYDDAINISKQIIGKAGAETKPRTYILLADSYLAKGDTLAAKPYIDEYFAKAKPEDVTSIHHRIKADIYSAIPGQDELVYSTYLEAVNADTTIDGKVDLLKQAALLFRKKGLREKEGDIMAMLIQTKPKLSINDVFDATRAYYFGQAYTKSYDMALKMTENFPNEVYGYQWKFNNLKILDSSFTENKLVPAAIEYFEFSQKDTAKYKRDYLSSAGFLLGYYANEAKDGAKALEYCNKMLLLDPANENLLKIKPQLEKSAKQPPPKSAGQPAKPGAPGSKLNTNKESTKV
ncbi:MAG TPA: tetratricopeptide repeat protein [Chitinophagaceae bacterium]